MASSSSSDPNVDRYDPDLWTDEFAFLSKPRQADIQSDLFYNYQTNVENYLALLGGEGVELVSIGIPALIDVLSANARDASTSDRRTDATSATDDAGSLIIQRKNS
jgi:hypothetical protein